MVSFVNYAVDFLVEANYWRITIVKQRFQWIVDAIDTLIDGLKPQLII
jgi:hypothetical protein